MADQTHLSVNLADPQDILDKLPEIRALYESKKRALADLQREVESWRGFLGHLASIAGEEAPEEPKGAFETFEAASRLARRNRAPAKDAVVEALRVVGRPMGPTDLYRFMVGNGFEKQATNPNAVGAALWGAVKAGRISKTSEGLYAPPGWTKLDKGDLLALTEGSTDLS
jgi:hypothetical protein